MNQNFILRMVAIVGLVLSAGLSGCASVQMNAPTAEIGTIEKIRSIGMGDATVGVFSVAPGKDPSMDKSLSGLRGSTIAPASGSFSGQLKDQIAADLSSSGLLKDGANIVISGQLTDSKIDAAIGTGTGRLAAIFSVSRDAKTVFQKEFSVDDQWESSFMGAIAIPLAMNKYSSFYQKLSRKLFEDPDFVRAVR